MYNTQIIGSKLQLDTIFWKLIRAEHNTSIVSRWTKQKHDLCFQSKEIRQYIAEAINKRIADEHHLHQDIEWEIHRVEIVYKCSYRIQRAEIELQHINASCRVALENELLRWIRSIQFPGSNDDMSSAECKDSGSLCTDSTGSSYITEQKLM